MVTHDAVRSASRRSAVVRIAFDSSKTDASASR
jgi:hypothetical protein